jgi:GxxExxY protein
LASDTASAILWHIRKTATESIEGIENGREGRIDRADHRRGHRGASDPRTGAAGVNLRRALAIDFQLRGIPFQRQVEVDVHYKGHAIKGQRLDLLVAGEVIVELKSVVSLPEVAMAQVLSYLTATGLRRALLINFGLPKLMDGVKRVSL